VLLVAQLGLSTIDDEAMVSIGKLGVAASGDFWQWSGEASTKRRLKTKALSEGMSKRESVHWMTCNMQGYIEVDTASTSYNTLIISYQPIWPITILALV
jgi:hypothetical protein